MLSASALRTLAAEICGHTPEFTCTPDELAERLDELQREYGLNVSTLRQDDLYLAYCVTRGCEQALDVFWETLVPSIHKAALSITKDASLADDVLQTVVQRLLMGDENHEPALSTFRGQSKLQRWLHSVAVRAGINAKRAVGNMEAEDGTEQLERLMDDCEDPELAVVKDESRKVVEKALRESLAELSSKHRLLLQQSVVDGMTIDDLAKVYRIHRASAARRLAAARAALLSGVRRKLGAQLKLVGREIDSLLLFARSRIQLSQGWFKS